MIAYMICECVGHSIYEQHTISYVYLKKEWAEYQMRILEASDGDKSVWYKIREVVIVEHGPEPNK